MIIRLKEITKRKRVIPYIIVLIVYTVLIFALQYFFHADLFEVSLRLTGSINQNETIRSCLLYFEKSSHILGNYKIYTVMFVLIFNWANIFKAYILLITISLGYLVGGCLKIIYHLPLMYYDHSDIKKLGDVITPIYCYASWGTPSVHSLTSTCCYLTLWKIIFDNHRLRNKNLTKFAFLFLMICIIFFINFCHFMAALHSLDQIIFGMLIGFQIFFFIFYVLQIDLNDGKFLAKVVNFNFIYHLLINIGIFGLVLIIYFFFGADDKTIKEYMDNIDQSDCYSVSHNLRLNNDALILTLNFFNNPSVILAMKYELNKVFESNELNWRQYNFNKEDGEDDSFLSKLSISREMQWNHTSISLSFLRLIVIIFFHVILFIPFLVVPFSSNFYLVIFVKIFFPLNSTLFFMFYFEKIILRKMGLTNDAIFRLMSENL